MAQEEKHSEVMNTRTTIILLILVLLAGFLRLYRFEDFMEFLGDQGRDARIAKQILVDRDFTLLGPPTSVGNMYLGPLYYYLMVPFLALTYPSPTGPAYAIAVLGILTVLGMYLLGRRMVGEWPALFAAVAYATAPQVVKLSRFSWQPNIAPFFGLLLLWSLWKGMRGDTWHWFWALIWIAILIQAHYVALLAGLSCVIAGLYWLYKSRWKGLIASIVPITFGILVLIMSFFPLVLFDLRHNGQISRGFEEFFTQRAEREVRPFAETAALIWRDSHGVSMRTTVELLGASKELRSMNTWLTIAFLVGGIVAIVRTKQAEHREGSILIFGSVLSAIVGLSIYRDQVFEHYFAYLFPAVFLLFGIVVWQVVRFSKLTRILGLLAVFGLSMYHISVMPYWGGRANGIAEIRALSGKILEVLPSCERCNIAGLNQEREYRAYKHRFVLEASGLELQDEYSYGGLKELIVVVENGEDPLQSPIYEIQEFVRESKGKPVEIARIPLKDEIVAYVYKKASILKEQ